MKFDKMDLASITDTYFSSLSKTINKLKVKRGDGVGGFKFEKLKYVCTFVDEPRHTLSGMRSENASGALPVFGSHYYETSTLAKKIKNEGVDSKEEPYVKKSDVDSILNKYFNKYNEAFRRLSE